MKDKKDKIYYFQEKSNDILDLQDELTTEEIGIYFILKAGYFKYAGELKKENANQRCKFFGDINKFNLMILKLFDEIEGLLVNNSWLSEIKGIKDLSKKRKEIAQSRWKIEQSEAEAKPKQNESKTEANVNVNKNVNEECKSELINHNHKSELDLFCDEIVISLKEILGRKLNRNIATSNWNKEIKLIVNSDLKIRGEQQAKQDLIKCIQAVENHYGKEYFPIIQSAKSLREKFIKIENYLERSPQAKKNKLDEEFLAMSRNNKGEF